MNKHPLLLAGFLVAASPAYGAMLRPFSQITGGTVHLADLFDDLGAATDRILGRAPAPGARIVINSPQLAAIARDYNVDWRPQTGGEQAVLERRGDVLSRSTINAVLLQKLAEAGAPADAELVSPDVQPIVIPFGSAIVPDVSQLSYDAQSGRFTALLCVTVPDMPETQTRISGQVIAMMETVAAAQRLTVGSVLTAADMRPMRVRATSLRGGALSQAAVIGLSAKHDIAAGQLLTSADVMRPLLVTRGMVVRMTLDSDGIALAAEGVAAEAGAEGDRIHIENPVSHRLVEAQVSGPGEVIVAPRAAAIRLAAAQ